jgi:hypothetical protein
MDYGSRCSHAFGHAPKCNDGLRLVQLSSCNGSLFDNGSPLDRGSPHGNALPSATAFLSVMSFVS